MGLGEDQAEKLGAKVTQERSIIQFRKWDRYEGKLSQQQFHGNVDYIFVVLIVVRSAGWHECGAPRRN